MHVLKKQTCISGGSRRRPCQFVCMLPNMQLCLRVHRIIVTDLHSLQLFVGSKGSCWDTFNQVLFQPTVERETARENSEEANSYSERKKHFMHNITRLYSFPSIFILTRKIIGFPKIPFQHEPQPSSRAANVRRWLLQ